jgi:anthranilate synthase/aminodeoxychorismate synthase-like glutamine amidotransferase
MRVLLVDAFDSFSFNLCQQLERLGAEVVIETVDAPVERLEAIDCDRIVLSPGPGAPAKAGLFLEVLDRLSPRIPTLGVCLGHQAVCAAFGGRIRRKARVAHGRPSPIMHDGTGLFAGLPAPFTATRYHSLVADGETLPDELVVTARSLDDGDVMGVRHRRLPIAGVQFHPESYLTVDGDRLISNFLRSGVNAG